MIKLKTFSKKQKRLLTWWCTKDKSYDAIICDGAIRSGKTICMSMSFIFWAFSNFENQPFALCGKTITSLKRNVISPLIDNLNQLGFHCSYKISSSYIDISYKNNKNRFYFFGGKDSGSASLIQGMTLAGIMFDEVALMPRSFVEQALARCSVPGSKFWFNCNPEHPFHWFYKEWIKKRKQKNALYLHFTMDDNPSLSEKMKKRYKYLYSGAFYDRFIKGIWTSVSGQVYTSFSKDVHIIKELPDSFCEYYVSCDYGTVNPASFGLWGKSENVFYRIKEYYFDSKKEGYHHTDEEYYIALKELISNLPINVIVVDPSAASFIECIRRHGEFCVTAANNDVIGGISLVNKALTDKKILFHESCKDSIREFSLYCWNDDNKVDSVKKENDHAMDDIRYFVSTIVNSTQDDFFVISKERKISQNNNFL